MKIFKERRHALINRPVDIGGVNYLSLGLMLYFDLTAPEELHTEQELWQELTPVLGQTSLDQGWPKPRGEVICWGSCHAPRGQTVSAAQVRLKVGPVDKRVNVFGDRFWITGPSGLPSMTRAESFTAMPVDWAHAFGGPEVKENPLGKGMVKVKLQNGQKAIPLPNIEGEQLIGATSDRPAPAGFAPFDLMWPQRAKKNGTYDQKWLKERWPALPEDMNYEFFCLAPEDQFLPEHFSGQEDILIQGMHPDMPVITSRLPRRRIRAFITRRDMEHPEALDQASFEEVTLKPETLWLFPDILRGVLLFRGLVRCVDDEYSDLARLLTADEDPNHPPKPLEHYRDEQLKKADLSVPFDPAMQQKYQQEMARAAKKTLNLPKKIKSHLAKNQGQAPVMRYTPDDLGRLAESNLSRIRQTIDSVEATATDLHSRFGHMMHVDFGLFSHYRRQAQIMETKVKEQVAKAKEIEKRRDELRNKARETLQRPEMKPLLVKGDIDPETIMDSPADPPFHARGFPLLVSWRLGLKLDAKRQKQLQKFGLEQETIANRWLAWNPEPRAEQYKDWGLEADPDQETFEIPAGLVLPGFSGRELVRLLIRPEPLDTSRREVLIPGSREEPLFLEAATEQNILVLVPDELSAAYAEQEVGDFAHIAVVAGPGESLADQAEEKIKNQALVIVLVAEEGIWAGWEETFAQALPQARLAVLPKARTIFPPANDTIDLRQAVVEQLPPEQAQKQALVFDPPGAPPKPGAKKLTDIMSAAGMGAMIRDGYRQGYAAKEKTFEARKADLLQKADAARDKMAMEGFESGEPAAAAPKRSMTEELNARADQVAANRDKMKQMGFLAPEDEAKYDQAIAKMREAGPQWDQQKSEGMAKLKAFDPPPEARAAFEKAGMDPEKLKPQPIEVVAKAQSGELELKGRTLKNLDLSGLDLSGLDLSECRIDTCLFKEARLTGVRLDGAMLQNCDLSGADLSGAILGRTVFKKCVFKQAVLCQATADMPVFKECDLTQADFSRARLNQTVFQKGVLDGLNLSRAELNLSIFSEAEAAGLQADNARFEKCVFKKLTLDRASLTGIATNAMLFHSCCGQKVTLAGSDLFKFRISHNSSFPGLNAAQVTWKQGYCRTSDLSMADMHGSILERTIFESCDLSQANLNRTGLVRCRFVKSSLESADMRFVNLHMASLRKSRLINADLGGANCFGVDFLYTVLGQTGMQDTNLKRSLLAGQEKALQQEGYIR
ncbi:MAG: DUF2169 domain-containing protein [Desulfovermiculus sp.]